MTLLHLTEHDYCISQWSGGTTTQIAIAPEHARYADRDFLWRVSSASVDLEESDFTALPDYDRWISTLHGTMTLSHNGEAPITLSPYQVHAFDGGANTHSWGRCTDFNLMLRKGQAQGSIRSLHLPAAQTEAVAFTDEGNAEFPHTALLLFCGKGAAEILANGTRIRMAAREAVVLQDAAGTALRVTATAPSSFLIAQMQTK